jgi:NADH-quinone oxidoreductase subunit M
MAIFVLSLGLWPAPLADMMSATVDNLVSHITQSKL